MEDYIVLCIDDEREILDAVLQDIDSLSSHFILEAAESVAEARELVEEYSLAGKKLALVLCDHLMPEEKGVDYLVELNQNDETRNTRKVLLTGQAGLEQTVDAVNRGGLDYYIAKPWDSESLMQVVIDQLTTYILRNEENLMDYISVLDQERLLNAIHESG